MRTNELYVCRDCRKVHDSDYHIERHWFDAFAVYDERVSDECDNCGGVIEAGCICDMCDMPVSESEAAFDDGKAYCPDCKRECMYCFEVRPSDEFTPSGEGEYEWCARCAQENREENVA